MLAGCATLTLNATPIYKTYKQQRSIQDELPFSVMEMQVTKARAENKGTAVMKRMIANSYYANGEIVDSNRYYFSEGRGTTNGSPRTYYSYYNISSHDQTKDILSDSAFNWHDYTGSLSWNNTDRYTYDAQNKVTSAEVSSPYFAWKYEAVYGNTGMLEQVNGLDTFGGTPLILKSTMYIEYDGQGKRIKDSTLSIASNTITGRRFYTYDASGNLIDFSAYRLNTGVWEMTIRNTFTYDSQNRLVTEAREGDYGMGFMKQSKDSFAYTGNNVEPTFYGTFIWDDNNAVWAPYERIVYTFGTSGFHDAYTIYRYQSDWDTIEHDVYVYDVNNLLVRSNGYRYMGNGQFSTTPYDQSTLYYEDYFPASVLNATEKKIDVQLFPNPVTDVLSIIADEVVRSIKIVSMNGAVVMQKDYNDKQVSLNISHLAPGNYVAVLTGADGGVLGHDKFVKQ